MYVYVVVTVLLCSASSPSFSSSTKGNGAIDKNTLWLHTPDSLIPCAVYREDQGGTEPMVPDAYGIFCFCFF